ncbi:dTMP kinase [Atopobacter phocae]|uniref:dTMP kinase n=1 Tax=Atopobacter phocae TaxID=136492 RepID=UPI000470C040|nr:dTMP kinase [Atopobacter phocae]
MNGLFITLEGPDGSGKTTALKRVLERFKAEFPQAQFKVTREPGGNPIAEEIRKIILDPDHTAMDARTEAILYAASRRQHLVETVLPALANQAIVLCDRYVDSSLVYQGVGRGIGIDAVAQLNEFATEGVMPTLTLYFDLSPDEGLKRIRENRPQETNRLDQEALLFHQKVYQGYKELVERFPNRIEVIQANQSMEAVEEAVYQALHPVITHYLNQLN